MTNKKIPTYNVNAKGLKGNDPTHQIVESDDGWDIEGNATFGKNVEVDGQVKVNEFSDIVDKDGNRLGIEEYYSLTLDSNEKIIGTHTLTKEQYDAIYNNGKPKNILLNNSLKIRVCGIIPIEGAGIDIVSYLGTSLVIPAFVDAIYIANLISTDEEYALIIGSIEESKQIVPLSSDEDVLGLSSTYIDDADNRARFATINGKSLFNNINDDQIKFNLQGTLYRHTITMSDKNDKAILCFTGESEKNLAIDSIQDLISVFGNTEFSATGLDVNDQEYNFYKIKIGTSITDTIVYYFNQGDSEFQQDKYADTSLVNISDNVTAM